MTRTMANKTCFICKKETPRGESLCDTCDKEIRKRGSVVYWGDELWAQNGPVGHILADDPENPGYVYVQFFAEAIGIVLVRANKLEFVDADLIPVMWVSKNRLFDFVEEFGLRVLDLEASLDWMGEKVVDYAESIHEIFNDGLEYYIRQEMEKREEEE